MTGDLEVTFECESCGGTVLELPDDYTDASIVKCKACGREFGTWGDVQAQAHDLAARQIRDTLGATFRGLKGWKVE